MKRREFIAGLGGAVAWPLAARRQQPRVPVVGYLSPSTIEGSLQARGLGFERRGLAEIGYVEGRNIAFEYRFADGQYDRLPELAAELVRQRVDVIYAPHLACALAAKAATQTIPIVFVTGGDPVEFGLVTNLNRPGGNITGSAYLSNTLTAKRLELLHELLPSATLFALLVNPIHPFAETEAKEAQTAASVLGVRVLTLKATRAADFEAVFATLAEQQVKGLLVGSDALFILPGPVDEFVAMAARHAVPTIYVFKLSARAGGLMSYGADEADAFRLGGVYVGRILKGEKPADLPVQQSTKVELVINMKTAKALGLTFPLTLLGRADEVIE